MRRQGARDRTSDGKEVNQSHKYHFTLEMNTMDHTMDKCERENKFKFIFTPVYWGEKKNLDLFLLPLIGEIK